VHSWFVLSENRKPVYTVLLAKVSFNPNRGSLTLILVIVMLLKISFLLLNVQFRLVSFVSSLSLPSFFFPNERFVYDRSSALVCVSISAFIGRTPRTVKPVLVSLSHNLMAFLWLQFCAFVDFFFFVSHACIFISVIRGIGSKSAKFSFIDPLRPAPRSLETRILWILSSFQIAAEASSCHSRNNNNANGSNENPASINSHTSKLPN